MSSSWNSIPDDFEAIWCNNESIIAMSNIKARKPTDDPDASTKTSMLCGCGKCKTQKFYQESVNGRQYGVSF